ncbi:MAG: ferrous iron transport protein A [Bacteroidetes bacterium]|nr:ferrous iron transport protein A [Bacteroidota bacterium]
MFRSIEKMTIRLIDCNRGDKVTIQEIVAGKGATINLMNLGLNIGNIVTINRKSHLSGPIVVTHNDSEIAIGHDLAAKILVKGSES